MGLNRLGRAPARVLLVVAAGSWLLFSPITLAQQRRDYRWRPLAGDWSSVTSWNWDDRLPGSLDVVHIERENPPLIQASIRAADFSAWSLFNDHEIDIEAGSLTISDEVRFGPSAILSVRNGGRFVAKGSADIGPAQVSVLDGGVVSIAGGITPIANKVLVNGPGSRLELPGAVSLSGSGGNPWTNEWPQVIAENGAVIDAPRVKTIGGGIDLRAVGVGSMIDLSKLETIGVADASNPVRLWAAGGGTIKTPNLSEVFQAEITCEGATSSIDLGLLKSLNRIKLVARGGAQLSLPQITAYHAGDLSAGLEASGAGSLLELPDLVDVGVRSHPSAIKSLDGGHLRLPVLTVIEQAASFSATGEGSVIDLPMLESFKPSEKFSTGAELSAVNGGRIATGKLQTLESAWVLVEGPTSSIALDQLTSISGSLNAREGGKLTMPGPASFQGTIMAAGTGSLVSLPNVRTARSPGELPMSIQATAGAGVDLSNLESIVDGVAIEVDGHESVVDLSRLAETKELGLGLRAGGTALLDRLRSASATELAADGLETTFVAPELAYVDSLQVTARTGSVVRLPALSRVSQGKLRDLVNLEAGDAGSRIELPALEELGLSADWASFFQVVASRGAAVELNSLKRGPAAGMRVRVEGSGSEAIFDSLAEVSAIGRVVSFELADGGVLKAKSLEHLRDAEVRVSGQSSRLELPQLVELRNSSLSVGDKAVVSLPRLADIQLRSPLSVGGGSVLELPSALKLDAAAGISVLQGSRIELPQLAQIGNETSTTQLIVRGVGSLFSAPELQQFHSPLTQTSSRTRILADQGRIDLGHGDLDLSNVSLEISGGGTVAAGRLAMLENSSLQGNGLLDASLENHGRLEVSVNGKLQITGNLTQTATATFLTAWGSSDRSPAVAVGGAAELDGAIEYEFYSELQLGDSSRLLTAQSIVGNFQTGERLLDSSRLLTTLVVESSVFAAVVLPGDANLDARVDLNDFGSLKAHFATGSALGEGDFSGDNRVDLSDFGLLKANFGRSDGFDQNKLRSPQITATVPEPASAWLLILGCLLAAFSRRIGQRWTARSSN
jgi:hypothetical protein